MEMNLPAPVGTAPVELATVESGAMESSVLIETLELAFDSMEML